MPAPPLINCRARVEWPPPIGIGKEGIKKGIWRGMGEGRLQRNWGTSPPRNGREAKACCSRAVRILDTRMLG